MDNDERPPRKSRTGARTRTLGLTELRQENRVARIGTRAHPEAGSRPVTRGDCLPGGCNEERPCPWVGCKHHLYLSVNAETGTITLSFPDREPWELGETCALDVADRGGITLEEVGVVMNLTRERIRQVEVTGLHKLKAQPVVDELRDL